MTNSPVFSRLDDPLLNIVVTDYGGKLHGVKIHGEIYEQKQKAIKITAERNFFNFVKNTIG